MADHDLTPRAAATQSAEWRTAARPHQHAPVHHALRSKLVQLEAALEHTYGGSQEAFGSLSDGLRDGYLCMCSDMASEARQQFDEVRQYIMNLEAVLRTARVHIDGELSALLESNSTAEGDLDAEAAAGATEYGSILQLIDETLGRRDD